jgi:hypothetical protein
MEIKSNPEAKQLGGAQVAESDVANVPEILQS